MYDSVLGTPAGANTLLEALAGIGGSVFDPVLRALASHIEV